MYCLGVVLYELLTGKRPFASDNISDLIRKILYDIPLPPSQLIPSLPGELDRIVLKTLEKAPRDRYASWADFAMELAEIGRLSAWEMARRMTPTKTKRTVMGRSRPEVVARALGGTSRCLGSRISPRQRVWPSAAVRIPLRARAC